MTKGDYFFHLGMAKTGSTLLQRILFPKIKGLQFHKKKHFDSYLNIIQSRSTENHLFSSEMDKHLIKYLRQIIQSVPSAKVIIVLREPSKWIVSKYKYSIRKHDSLDFRMFFDLYNNKGQWKKEQLLFSHLIKKIKSICNEEPLFLSFDELHNSPHLFLKKIEIYTNSHFSGNAFTATFPMVNTAFSYKQLSLLKAFNKFYPYKEVKTKSRIINKVHYKYREFLLHAIALIAQALPYKIQNPLIDVDYLIEIKSHFKMDWNQCLTLIEESNPIPVSAT